MGCKESKENPESSSVPSQVAVKKKKADRIKVPQGYSVARPPPYYHPSAHKETKPIIIPEAFETLGPLLSPRKEKTCHRCGVACRSVKVLVEHLDACVPGPCPHCQEVVFAGLLQLCPKTLKLSQSKRVSRSQAARCIQRAWRRDPGMLSTKAPPSPLPTKFSMFSPEGEGAFFVAIQNELNHGRENNTMARMDSQGGKGERRRSVHATQCTKNDVPPGHWCPTATQSLTSQSLRCLTNDLSRGVRVPYAATWRILQEALDVLSSANNVQPVTLTEGKVVVVGDLHGQLEDLVHILHLNGTPSSECRYVFNGDFVDRGANGFEIVLMLCTLVVVFPRFVFLNRGNHEVTYMNEEYGFDIEVTQKYDSAMYHFVQGIFNVLPLAVLINTTILVVHGGIPRDPRATLEFINKMDRKRPTPYPQRGQSMDDEVFQDLMWADPQSRPGMGKSVRGVGYRYGPDVSQRFMEANKIALVLRSHEVCAKGFEEHHGGSVYTVFSASDYDGNGTNRGSFAILTPGTTQPKFYSYRNEDIDFGTFSFTRPQSYQLRMTLPNYDDVDDTESSERAVFRYIRGQIYDKRLQMLGFFSALDSKNTGDVWVSDWVFTMRTLICATVPWRTIQKTIVRPQYVRAGKISYISFLYCFQTEIMTRWTDQWQHRVAHKFSMAVALKGTRIDPLHFGTTATVDTVVAYPQICAVMNHFQAGLSEQERFHLFRFFDVNGDGRVYVRDIMRVLEAGQHAPTTSGANKWEMDVMQELQHLFMSGRISISHIFQSMDTDSSWELTKDKFQKGMVMLNRALQVPLEIFQVERLFDFLDVSMNGVISYKDFRDAFSVQDV